MTKRLLILTMLLSCVAFSQEYDRYVGRIKASSVDASVADTNALKLVRAPVNSELQLLRTDSLHSGTGGTLVLVPTGSLPLSGRGVILFVSAFGTDTVWVRKEYLANPGTINVLWAGARPDSADPIGTTNAINACFVFASQVGGKVFQPAGKYLIDSSAGYHPIWIRPATWIGVRGQTIIYRVTSQTNLAPMVRNDIGYDSTLPLQQRNYYIDGIKLVGSNNGIYSGRVAGGFPPGSTAEAGFSITGTHTQPLNNVTIVHSEVIKTQREAFQVWNAEHILMYGNRSIANNLHAYNTGPYTSLIFVNNFADSCYLGNEIAGWGKTRPAGMDTTSNTLIIGNTFTNSLGYGLQLSANMGDALIANNQFSAAKDSFAKGFLESYGILIKQNDGGTVQGHIGLISIRNNTFKYHGDGIAVRGVNGYDSEIEGLAIDGNDIIANREGAIVVQPAVGSTIKQLSVTNNRIRNWNRKRNLGSFDASAIYLQSVVRPTVTGNSVSTTEIGESRPDPIYLLDCDSTTVVHNDFTSRYSPNIHVIVNSSVGTQVYQNLGIEGTLKDSVTMAQEGFAGHASYSINIPQVEKPDSLLAKAIMLKAGGSGLSDSSKKQIVAPSGDVFPNNITWSGIARGQEFSVQVPDLLGHVKIRGPQMIRNRFFDDGDSLWRWNPDSDFAVVGGKLKATTTAQNAGFSGTFNDAQTLKLSANSLYRFKWTIDSISYGGQTDSVFIIVTVAKSRTDGTEASTIKSGYWRKGTDSVDFVNIYAAGAFGTLFGNNATARFDSISLQCLSGGNTGDIVRWDGTNWVNSDSIPNLKVKTLTVNGSVIGGTRNMSQKSPADPTGTTSATAVMMGLADTLTPYSSGKVLVIISGSAFNTGPTLAGGKVAIRYGTGTPPTNGAAATGTAAGNVAEFQATVASFIYPFTCSAFISGLTVNTTYWFDLALLATTTGTASCGGIGMSVVEQ